MCLRIPGTADLEALEVEAGVNPYVLEERS